MRLGALLTSSAVEISRDHANVSVKHHLVSPA